MSRSQPMRHAMFGPIALTIGWVMLVLLPPSGCDDERQFARVSKIETMAQTIGGPAAFGRPGDYLLENDRIRAIVHGRHNKRSTQPITNGSLVDLDIQRPHHEYGNGRGRDAFYELASMVNLKVSSATSMETGACDAVGEAPCPLNAQGEPNRACVRLAVGGAGDNIMGMLGLLDIAIEKRFPAANVQILADYDLCPGESLIRISTTARFPKEKGSQQKGERMALEPFAERTSLLTALLGESSDIDCGRQPCPSGMQCDDLLASAASLALPGGLKRCRKPADRIAGVMTGDFTLFSGKVNIFVPGNGFDHDTYIRSVFDSGGDIFSNPLALDYVAAVADGVSYVYFSGERSGKVMVPVFESSFTVSMTNSFGCSYSDPGCLDDKDLTFSRFVSVGQGDVASALAGYYRLRGIETGRLEGHVIDARDREPVSHIDVFALRVPQAWVELRDDQLAARGYAALVEANREQTRGVSSPVGDPGIISHFRTDVGLDTVADGSFAGPLPAGRYLLVTRDAGRPPSKLVPIRIAAGVTTDVMLVAQESGTLEFSIDDERGRPLPSKLTIGHCFAECARDEDCGGDTPFCFLGSRKACERTDQCPEGEICGGGKCESTAPHARLCVGNRDDPYPGPQACRPDQLWDDKAKTCRCPADDHRWPLELGGGRLVDGSVRALQTASGHGLAALPPGGYQVIVSRGVEYEIVRRYLEIRPGVVTRLKTSLRHVVDSSGWISADFHVHGPNSVDSGIDHDARVTSYAAEGVDLLSSSDHDYLTDYGPTIYKLGLQPWLKSQVGLEVSPLDYGHFLGFPLRFDENAELNGAFHWREHLADNALPDWKNLSPSTIYQRLRALGQLGPENTVTAVAHYYDHFTYYGVDPWTLELPQGLLDNFNALVNPVLNNFSGDFDAVEIFTGKNYDTLRRPTYREVRDYNNEVNTLLARSDLRFEERQRRWAAISAAGQRLFVAREPEEQALAIDYHNRDFDCRCASDGDCSGYICDRRIAACRPPCASDAECDAALVAAGRERCLPIEDGRSSGERVCRRIDRSCTRTADCLRATFGGAAERCLVADAAQPAERSCQLPCGTSADCQDQRRPTCRDGLCRAATPATEIDPCPTVRGTVDDWFQMLNHGARRSALGNSDSHGAYDGEAGLPRNFLLSDAKVPAQIKPIDVVHAVKGGRLIASFGPLVELSIDGQPIGSLVSVEAGKPVALRVRVQSPTWFDVDRVEVYRNGKQIHLATGKVGCVASDASCLALPNAEVVNYDQVIEDRPGRDAWYVVIAAGVDGKAMAPVFSSTPIARLGIFEVIQRLTPLLPPLRALRVPFTPTITRVRPYAVTNPIWVDVGGDGFRPLHAPPSWAREVARSTSAITTDSQPSQGHDHRHGLGRMHQQAAELLGAVKGPLTLPILRQAIRSLRYQR